jgi:hypothetical protein
VTRSSGDETGSYLKFDVPAFLPPFAFYLFPPSPKIRHFIFHLFHNMFDFSSFAFFKNPKLQKEVKRTLEKKKQESFQSLFCFRSVG